MLWLLVSLSAAATCFWWFERKLLWNVITLALQQIFHSCRAKEPIPLASAMGLLHSGMFGAFSPPSFTKESLDEAIRKKQLIIWSKLNLHSFDALLEIDSENCLFSLTFAHKQGIICDCIIHHELTLQHTKKLVNLFSEYRNVRLHSQFKWQKASLSNYYDAIIVSSTFCLTLSYWQLQEFLQVLLRSARINCQVYIEVYAASRWTEALVNYVRLSANAKLSWFLSIKCIIHAVNAAGFEVLEMDNCTSDALETAKCCLSNLKTLQKNEKLQQELEVKICALEEFSLSAWSILATKNDW